jgi:serine/threonine protein phosphatase PrpC
MSATAHEFLARDMDAPELVPVAGGVAAVFSQRHPERGGPNQDAAMLLSLPGDRCVLALADGMGGLPGGEDAAATALRALANSVRARNEEGTDLRVGILDGIEAGNRAILESGAGSGSTLVVVEVVARIARSYHVGDSAVLLVGQRGRRKHATVAHSPVGYAVEAGLLDAEAAMVHEDRHLVSNMLGSQEMKIEIGPKLELAARDTLLLASDGLLDNLREDEIIERIRKGPLEEAAATLARDTLARMRAPDPCHPSKPDDLTFVLFRAARE